MQTFEVAAGPERTELTDRVVPLHMQTWWMALHLVAIIIGGCSYIAASAILYQPFFGYAFVDAAWLYTVGSTGYLVIDLSEFAAFPALRRNIFINVAGSILYIIGSIGYFPSIYQNSALTGLWGMSLGSALIFVSQCWKLYRVGLRPVFPDSSESPTSNEVSLPSSTPTSGAPTTSPSSPSSPTSDFADFSTIHLEPPSPKNSSSSSPPSPSSSSSPMLFRWRNWFENADSTSAFALEMATCQGALWFFIGTLVQAVRPYAVADSLYLSVVHLWMIGSVCYTCGALAMAYRHLYLRI